MTSILQLLRRPLLLVAGFSFLLNLLQLVPSLFMLQVFDRVLTGRSIDTLLVLLVGAAVALALLGGVDYLRSRLQGIAGQLVGDALSPVVMRLSVEEGAQRQGGGDATRDVAALRGLFSAQGLLALFDAPWLVIYIAVIALAHPLLGLTAAVAALVMLVLAVVNDRWTRADIDAVQKAAGSTHRYLENSLANAEVVHAMGMTGALVERWRALNGHIGDQQRRLARRTVRMAVITRVWRQAVQVGMLAVGAWLVITTQASPGVMIACTILLGKALAPMEQIVGSWKVLAEGRAAWQRLRQLLDGQRAVRQRMALPAPRGQLSASQLMMRSPQGDRWLLSGVSLHLEAGHSMAVIGPSGAGKTTLLRLLIGLGAPTGGTVRLDGADLTQWQRDALGPHLGYLPQDVELFPGTVAENIARLGEVDGSAVVEAARRAGVHELILSLPEGYDTRIDPQSPALSPGQRQRIGLARALYGRPKLVVLDEPNSNLDSAGEQALTVALQQLQGETTVVVVTHRSALVQHVDKLLVLDAGRAVHFGDRDEVLARMTGARPAAVPGAVKWRAGAGMETLA